MISSAFLCTATNVTRTTPLDSVADIRPINTPTEVDHYQLRPVIDVYVMPLSEDLGGVSSKVNKLLANLKKPEGILVKVRGTVVDMHESFKSFGIGLLMAVVLVYLILMAQLASFSDPVIILLAVPPGLSGVCFSC